jgi:hypothetical protein
MNQKLEKIKAIAATCSDPDTTDALDELIQAIEADGKVEPDWFLDESQSRVISAKVLKGLSNDYQWAYSIPLYTRSKS